MIRAPNSNLRRLWQRARDVFEAGGSKAVARAVGGKLRWHARQLLFRRYKLTKSFAGHDYLLLIPDLFAEGWYGPARPWPELEWVVRHLRPGQHVVDCGANIGFTSCLFSRHVGADGRVTAIEALPVNADVVRRNAVLNGCSNIDVLNVAVGATVGAVDFLDTPNGAVGSVPGIKSRRVPMDTLDSLLGQQRVDFLKVDVEGYELEVLKGAPRVLEQAPAFDIEIHCFMFKDARKALRELLALIRPERYELWIQEEVDGEIVAVDDRELDVDRLASKHVIHLFATPVRA
jgi:FkbM family methyltransferase